jgi:hypothetical protein
MKILLYKNNGSHHKNKNALQKYKNIKFINVDSLDNISNLNEYHCVLSLCQPIDVIKYPNVLFLFGPQFSVFPDSKINSIKQKNVIYLQPSIWARDVWINYNNGIDCNCLRIESMPFGVETETFKEIKPIIERNKVFLYYKHREHNELDFLTRFLNSKNIEYHIFSYDGRYNESDYLHYLQESKYGIILDAHESQGFAIQEALSCNVPLFVWNVSSLTQEVGTNYPDFPATTIPYWDERCGEFFYNKEEIEDKFQLFLSKFETYNPRQYILETLSMEVCERRLIDFINEKKSIIETTP